MGELSDARREEVWCSLSDLVSGHLDVDNNHYPECAWIDVECFKKTTIKARDIHYAELVDIDLEQLEDIFFNEVAICLGPYYLAFCPTVWECGLEHDELIANLRTKRERRKNSVFALLIQKSMSLFYRSTFKENWYAIVKGLEEYRQKSEQGEDIPPECTDAYNDAD